MSKKIHYEIKGELICDSESLCGLKKVSFTREENKVSCSLCRTSISCGTLIRNSELKGKL